MLENISEFCGESQPEGYTLVLQNKILYLVFIIEALQNLDLRLSILVQIQEERIDLEEKLRDLVNGSTCAIVGKNLYRAYEKYFSASTHLDTSSYLKRVLFSCVELNIIYD